MSVGDDWRGLFENWPEVIAREGLVQTNYGESIPFVDFMLSGGIVLLDRDKPDSQGGRKVMIAYEAISAVKIVKPIDLSRFQVMGFQPPL